MNKVLNFFRYKSKVIVLIHLYYILIYPITRYLYKCKNPPNEDKQAGGRVGGRERKEGRKGCGGRNQLTIPIVNL